MNSYLNKRQYSLLIKTFLFSVILISVFPIHYKVSAFSDSEVVKNFYLKSNPTEPGFHITGKRGISFNASTNEILYAKNIHERAYPASITKVMTSIIIMEEIEDDAMIPISYECLLKPKSNSQIEFQEGELISKIDALNAIMVLSANDISCAVSEYISGDETTFGELMTKKAKLLGAKNSQFKNAHGLFDEEHYTTPYDMALITKEAIKYPEIVDAMCRKTVVINTNLQNTKVSGKGKYYDRENIIGGKTGWVPESGNTLVEVVKVEGEPIINVIMDSPYPQLDDDMERLYQFAKSNLKKEVILDKHNSFEVEIEGRKIEASPNGSLEILVNKNDIFVDSDNDFTKSIDIVFKSDIEKDHAYKNGIQKNQQIGYFILMENGEEIGEVEAVASDYFVFKNHKNEINKMNVAIFSFLLSGFFYFLFSRRNKHGI